MKKICPIFLMCIITLGVISCSDDDNDKKEIPLEIVGKWKLEDMEIGVLQTSDEDIEEIAREVFKELSKEFDYGEIIEFYENGTGTYKGESIKFSVDKYTLTMVDSDGYKLKFSFVVFNEKLILTLNMKEIILNEMTDELSKEEIAYIKGALQQFTIDFTYKK